MVVGRERLVRKFPTVTSSLRRVLVAVGAAVVVLVMPHQLVRAQTSTSAEQALAERFAPVMMLVAQSEPCDANGEPYDPVPVSVVLDNPEVAVRQVGDGDPVARWGVSAEELAGYGGGFFLDSPGVALDPGCLYETDGRRFAADTTPTIYARVVPPSEPGQSLALQYWFYWYFNDWNNRHEADWEGIQLVFDAPDATGALASVPTSLGYAQHEGGERSAWDDPKVSRDGDRPFVYSSVGSHASYFTSAVYLGRGASEGFGCDATTGDHRRVDPEVVLLPTDADDATGDLAWLRFTGRWGERWSGPYNGPTGPADKERWHDPLGWHERLRDGSITIPGGEGTAARLIDGFCTAVGWGSTQVIQLQLNPVRVLVPTAALGLAAWWMLRRTGGHLRRGVETLRSRPRQLLPLGLLGLPVSAAVGVLVWLTRAVPVVDDLVELIDPRRSDSPTRLIGSMLTGGAAIAAAFTVVTAAVAVQAHRGEVASDYRTIVAQVFGARWKLLGVLVLTAVPVTLLTLTTLGIPIALWLFARWHLAPTVVMREGLGARAALRRSGALVRGRTGDTLMTALLAQAAVLGAGVVVGLIVLTTITALPFWTLTMVVTGVGVVVMPWAAAVVVGLYDDATA